MSETATEAPAEGTEQPQEGTEAAEAQQPESFDADYVAKLRQESAKYRTQAKANADAAKELAAIKESQKSDAEKSADRITALEGELTTARTKAFRDAVVRFGGISQEDADLFLTGSDEETLNKQLERLVARSDAQKKQGNFVPGEGTAPKPGEGSEGAFARQLFAGD